MLMFGLLILAAGANAQPCADANATQSQREIDEGAPCKQKAVRKRSATAAEQTRIKRFFDASLFDGPSARWRFVFVAGGSFVCGYVNAKNRLGAYVGWTPFTFDLADGTGTIYQDPKDSWLFNTICLGSAVPKF